LGQKDVFYSTVKDALEKDGWIITHDPYPLKMGKRNLFVDLGAEAPLGAEKEGRKIAVEIKSFIGTSEITDLERALGQYSLYLILMSQVESDRQLYMAVPMDVFHGILSEPDGRRVLEALTVNVIVFDPIEVKLEQWIEWSNTER
jgi:hypothetical protein